MHLRFRKFPKVSTSHGGSSGEGQLGGKEINKSSQLRSSPQFWLDDKLIKHLIFVQYFSTLVNCIFQKSNWVYFHHLTFRTELLSIQYGTAIGNKLNFFLKFIPVWLDEKLSNQPGNGKISKIILHSKHPKNIRFEQLLWEIFLF